MSTSLLDPPEATEDSQTNGKAEGDSERTASPAVITMDVSGSPLDVKVMAGGKVVGTILLSADGCQIMAPNTKHRPAECIPWSGLPALYAAAAVMRGGNG